MVDQATGAVSRQNGERGTARGSGAPVCPPAVWVKRTRSPWTSGGGALSGRATPAKVTPRVRSRKVVDRGSEETEGHQGAGHAGQVEGGPANWRADGGAARGLQHEVLGNQGRHERLAWLRMGVHGSDSNPLTGDAHILAR